MSNESPFNFYRVSELTEDEKKPPGTAVENMIPDGLTIMSGMPKIRKSWLALQMAIAVAKGELFLGRNTRKSDVVYLDLEGTKGRVSSRTTLMNVDVPDSIRFTNTIKHKLNGELVEDLRILSKENPELKLIIIDPYGRAKGKIKSGGANAYDVDVEILEPLQRMAQEQKIAVVCIHHDRKGASSMGDELERTNGTMGVTGSADCIINLISEGKRFDGKAHLICNPRDFKGWETDLVFDEAVCTWYIPASDTSIIATKIPQWVLRNKPEKGKAAEFYPYQQIAEETGSFYESPGEAIRPILEKCKGQLYETYRIGIQLGVSQHGSRGIRLINLC